MLQVNLLGSFDIAIDGKRIHTELGPSGQRMASYLFTYPGRKHRREHLADLFWPTLTLERSRRALNSALWRMRRVLTLEPASNGGSNLTSLGSEVLLDPAPWLEIDIRVLETATLSVETEGANGSRITTLRDAIDLYQGPFLDQEEGDWILEERERIHTVFVRACLELIKEYWALGEYEEAAVICRRVLAVDPFREHFVRHLLVLLCLSERRAEAIRFYRRWKLSLRQELGIDPMPATIEMISQIARCETSEQVHRLQQILSCGRAASSKDY